MYKQQYIKYKEKYLKLKNALIQNGGLKFTTYAFIPELCHDTNVRYKNCQDREVNNIEINVVEDEHMVKLHDAIKLQENSNLPEKFKKYILEEKKDKIYYLVGFYNVMKRYDLQGEANCKGDDCGLDVGTVVNMDRTDTIFTQEFRDSDDYLNKLDKMNGNYVSVKGRKFGVSNLRKAMENIKKLGAEYIYLHPSGGLGLIDYYRNLGFEYKIDKVVFMNLDDQDFFYEPPLMLGDVDVILSKLQIQ